MGKLVHTIVSLISRPLGVAPGASAMDPRLIPDRNLPEAPVQH